MSSVTTQLKEQATWKTIFHGQCAFRSTNLQTGNLRCKHLFTNTSECHFVGCPIVQSNYVSVQRSYDTVYLVSKKAGGKISETWSDEELPADRDAALKMVTGAVSKLNPVLKQAVLAKFDHLFNVSTAIKASEAASDEDSEADDEES